MQTLRKYAEEAHLASAYHKKKYDQMYNREDKAIYKKAPELEYLAWAPGVNGEMVLLCLLCNKQCDDTAGADCLHLRSNQHAKKVKSFLEAPHHPWYDELWQRRKDYHPADPTVLAIEEGEVFDA